ncbi:hypothetical protein AB838_00895 [Rhodobacteraceae bacterium (ex Bugula neritina AB1)]|nr:hypothetical protein AB838_00895 [Rhodobacteraceae bacterium (ex Bugula neritina AB1)]
MAKPDQNEMVVIVEDNDDDFEAIERALLHGGNFAGTIKRCLSGQAVLNFLNSLEVRGASDDGLLPGLIILDLNLLGLTGHEVLSHIKRDPRWRMVPVVVLTSSTAPRDVDACYRAGANAYLRKEMELDTLYAAVARLKEFWLEAAVLPSLR